MKKTLLLFSILVVSISAVGYLYYVRQQSLELTLILRAEPTRRLDSKPFFCVKDSSHLEGLERLIGRKLPEVDFGKRYLYYSSFPVKRVKYRRYKRFLSGKSWYPAIVEFDRSSPGDSLYVYESNTIYVAMPVFFQ